MKTNFIKVGRDLSLVASLSVAVALGSSCAAPGKKTAIGAGAGAATGAVIGGATGGWKGAGIGGLAGAAVGSAFGNLLDKRKQELEQVAETRKTQEGLLVKLKNDLLFETGKDQLKPDAVQNISQLGDILAKYPDDKIRIEGFTDNVGSEALNQDLSLRRAQAVRNVLVSKGVKDEQLAVIGYGKNRPVADNKTSQGKAQNRRVELHIEVPQA